MGKQPVTQTFEFVTFEDAHRARSCAMRQSWRKRKQKILQHRKEEENAEQDSCGRGPMQRKAQRALAAKEPVKCELGKWDEGGASTCLVGEVDCMEIDSGIMNDSLGESAIMNTFDNATCIPYDIDQLLEMADRDIRYLDVFQEDGLINTNYEQLLPANETMITMDDILSPLALDPFDTFPIRLTTRHHELLHHWLTSHAAMMFESDTTSSLEPSFNPMRDVWFPLDLSNEASFYGIMAHSAAHLAYIHGQRDNVEVLKYKSAAVSLINSWLQDGKRALDDTTFAAVVRLLTFERYWGTEAVWRIHRDGLDRMIQARGGLKSLKQNWRLGLVLQLISLMSKPSWFFPSNNISEISNSLNYLRISGENNSLIGPSPFTTAGIRIQSSGFSNHSEIPKLRSLWLISFVQDMRSLMANSSNLQSVGLRHYHSIYEAVTILRNSFLESMRNGDDALANVYEHDRIACLFYIGVMIQECVSSKYHNTIATAAATYADSNTHCNQIISASNLPMCTVHVQVDERTYDRLATLDKALYDHKSIWMASIPQLEGFLLNHFMNHLGNVNRAEYVLQMTEVLTSLSREARNGVERSLLAMFGGKFGNIGSSSAAAAAVVDQNWTADDLLMSIHGG